MRNALVLLTTATLIVGLPLAGAAVARDRAERIELTLNQIVDQADARIARIKANLRLTSEQEKYWLSFESAMRDIAKKRAEREVAARGESTRPQSPIDAIEQMRKEAEFMTDFAADQKMLADAAQPLFVSLDDRQKRRFVDELLYPRARPGFGIYGPGISFRLNW